MGSQESVTFGLRLKVLREAAGLSQQALGSKAGVSVFTVSKIERGVQGPTWDVAVKLADALGADLKQFRVETKEES